MRSSAELHQESNSAIVTIELRDEELRPYLDQAVRKLRSQVRIPGFRKGHVPTSVLVARLGQEAVRREAVEDAVQENYEGVIVENGLDVIQSPNLRIVDGAEEGDVKVELDVALRPVVKVEGIGSIEIEVPRVELTNADVDTVIDSIREQMATLNEVERAAEEGDQVTFNVITVDGEREDVVTPYLTARLGKGEVSSEFEAALVGSQVGDKVPVATTGESESAEDGEAQPDTKSTVLEVLAVRELVLPELDAEFVGQVSEFSTVEELREDVRSSMTTRRVTEARSLFEQQLYQKVLELTEPKTVPEALLNSAYQQELHEFGHALDGSGISLRRYLEMSQQDENALAGQLSSKAAQSVLWDLALRAIAIDEAVSVEPAEVQAEIERLTASGAIESRPGGISPLQEFQVRTTLIKQKAYQRLANVVTIKDVDGNEVTLSQLGLDQLVEAETDVDAEPAAVPEQ
ncbi:trigger factor [Ferrimicrobium acidiphilum]|uniref:Trigger factor n=1 Tax=Ferrimicrobium acidiphilum DSM 19497 TaxID=1121877 RepID=A0A0D8FY46_9ACTN|nr:trigger factor [Ferrimicrobium acidiphilum]KJE78076.1 trigger factor [Ferrimicrobium acidiphilum DSM 19497]